MFSNVFCREVEGCTGDHWFLGIDFEALVSHLEDVVELPYSLEVSQDQEPSRLERVVKYWEQLLLQSWPKIDQQVPTHDQVKLRKRRVPPHRLPCDEAQPTDPLSFLLWRTE